MSSNNRLVYSTDPKDQVHCDRCKEFKADCKCAPEVSLSASFTVVFRLEKNGRGGKTVTVLDGFPRHETYLKELTKELKAKCGSGGTYVLKPSGGLIEIQGDKREPLKKILSDKKIKFKGV